MKKSPKRMCIACREMKDKRELIRIVKDKENNISLDFTGKMSGRGAYICASAECIEKCIKTKAINRAFAMNAQDEIYKKIKEDFLEQSE